jgi:diacylglycerol O-acyltransferase / wax synthase
MPDPEFYHDCLVASYEELYAAAIKLDPGRPRSAAVAAKAKIRSPKRERAVAVIRGKGQTVPKLRSANHLSTPAAISTPATTAKATLKAKTAPKKTAGKPKPRASATRLKATRRAITGTKPKLGRR